MKAPEVKNAPRFNVSFMNLTEDPDGAYIEYKYVEKHLTQTSATLLAAVAKVRKLTAELARVKADSLRVVYLPDDYPYMGDYYITPTGIGWNSSDRHGDGCVETPEGYHKFDECRKIKLERWEDE